MQDLTIAFTLREGGGEWAPSLSLLPTMETIMWDGSTPRESTLIPVTLELDSPRLNTRWDDHLQLRDFQQLRGLLRSYARGTPGSLTLRAEEAGFALRLDWQEQGQNVVFTGQIPSADYGPLWEHHLAQDPLALRKWMRTSLSFEFWMEPEQLAEPLRQVDAFLGYFQDVYEGRGRRSRPER